MPAVIALLAVGCASVPARHEREAVGMLPDAYSEPSGATMLVGPWWSSFGSAALDTLVDETLEGNLSLRQAYARLDQAGAVADQVASAIYPTLTAEAGASYEHRRTTVESSTGSPGSQVRDTALRTATQAATQAITQAVTGTPSSSGGSSGTTSSTSAVGSGRIRTDTTQYSLGLAASYEIDLWGRIASERRAAELDVLASREDLATTVMTLAAEVATRWLSVVEQQALLDLLNDQLATNRTYLELVELRFKKSLVSALDVYQQRQAVAQIEKQIPLAQARMAVLEHELAVLAGKPPSVALDIGTYDLTHMPPLPDVGVPAHVLALRPDVRAAWSRLRAADYRVMEAKADRLPALRLTGRAAYSAGEFEFLFDDWFANLAANLAAPLFDGHRREAEVKRTQAVVDERLANYKHVVLTAIREVEDALVNERRQKEYIEALDRQLDFAANALREASQRYKKGLSDYLPVLNALETVQRLTQDKISAQSALLIYRVNLYRALGGDWTASLPAPHRPSTDTDDAGQLES